MKPARLIILAVAVIAAGLAGLLAMNMGTTTNVVMQPAEKVVEKEPTTRVLVSAENLQVGARLTEKTMRWMEWPKSAVVTGFLTEQDRPKAVEELSGAVVRFPMFEGEPVRVEKIADASSHILSAMLPQGKRAVSTEISVATGAGGFILPNDRVDVVMVRKDDAGNQVSETALSNVRVLAIDQQIEQKTDGSKTVLGTTATLELTPEQVHVLASAQQMAERLSLALRSLADAGDQDTSVPKEKTEGGGQVQLIKAGQIVKATGGPANVTGATKQ